MTPDFSIVTPSRNQPDFLPRAVASVTDQEGVRVEHLVQDAHSELPTREWLRQMPHLKVHVEADHGMYDALNRGFARAQGKLLGWLNCDEQYLPDTLRKVKIFMDANPEVDLVFGNALVVDRHGQLLAFRKFMKHPPLLWNQPPLDILSCSLFFRKSLWDRGGHFDTRWKSVGDHDWFLKCIHKGAQIHHLPEWLGTYMYTGKNLSHDHPSLQEGREWQGEILFSGGITGRMLLFYRRLQKFLGGCYFSGPIEYQIYSDHPPAGRVNFISKNPSWKWPGK